MRLSPRVYIAKTLYRKAAASESWPDTLQGTAGTESVELYEMYKLPVERVPPHRPVLRRDNAMEVSFCNFNTKLLQDIHTTSQDYLQQHGFYKCSMARASSLGLSPQKAHSAAQQ